MRKITICLSLALAFVLTSFCPAQTAPGKRPMTFEDLMKMKRLGDTAVSPDGKWLAYGVITVNLDQNTKTAELWIQAIAGGEPKKLAVAQPGDSGIQFASDGRSVLFLSGREGGQQVWKADFDAATGATANPKKLTAISTEAGDAIWSPDGHSVLFTSAVYPDCPVITPADAATGDKCNADRDTAAAASKVKAQIFTHLLYRHWDHYTGEKRSHLFLLTVATVSRKRWDLLSPVKWSQWRYKRCVKICALTWLAARAASRSALHFHPTDEDLSAGTPELPELSAGVMAGQSG